MVRERERGYLAFQKWLHPRMVAWEELEEIQRRKDVHTSHCGKSAAPWREGQGRAT